MARGGATLSVLALGGGLVHAQVARADSAGQLSPEQLGVLGALGSAILVAAGKTGDGSDLGLVSPAALAQSFAGLDPESQANVGGLLDLIEAAPTAGSFSSLSSAQRQAFLRGALAPLGGKATPELALQQTEQSYQQYAAALQAGTLSSSSENAPDVVPPDLSPVASPDQPVVALSAPQALANALLDALALVATPPPPDLPAPPPPLVLPAGALASLAAQLLAGVPVDQLQGLLGQLDDAVDAADAAAGDPFQKPPQPVPVLQAALLALVPRA